MTPPLLKDVDGDTLYFEFLPLVERSFGFEFGANELESISTFGQFCEVVQSKMPTAESNDCTQQQAFYKLRHAVAQHLPTASLTPATALEELFPRSQKQREQIIEAIESELGFPLNILGMSNLAGTVIFCAFSLSIAAFFYRWQAGTAGLFLMFAGGYLLGKFCLSLEAKNIKEVVEKMTRENYRQVRRNPNTVNRHEIVLQIQALFQHELAIECNRLTPNARF